MHYLDETSVEIEARASPRLDGVTTHKGYSHRDKPTMYLSNKGTNKLHTFIFSFKTKYNPYLIWAVKFEPFILALSSSSGSESESSPLHMRRFGLLSMSSSA